MTRSRKGLSLIELLTVFAVVGVMVGLSMPKFAAYTERSSVSSGRQQVLAAYHKARATAVRRGLTATVYLSGNTVRVTADSSGTEVDILAKTDLLATTGTTLSSTGNVVKISYNMRGLSSNAAGKVYISRGSRSDSICVTTLGAVMREGCL